MRGVAVAVAVAAAAVVGVGVAGAQETPTTTRERAQLSFGGSDPLKVKWADVSKGVRVELFNETSRALTVTVQLTDFAAEKGTRRFTPKQLAAKLIPAKPLDLPPGQSKRVTVKAARAKRPPDGTYAGSVVAFVQECQHSDGVWMGRDRRETPWDGPYAVTSVWHPSTPSSLT